MSVRVVTTVITCLVLKVMAIPDLIPGVWKNITPDIEVAGTYGFSDIALDPSDPRTIYVSGTSTATFKSTDGGETWALLGDPSPSTNPPGGTEATQVAAACLRIDPKNPLHLYATRGVTADRAGFWVSTDGGAHWKIPPAFLATGTTRDVTMLDINPLDFDHALVMSHSPWAGQNSSGILETKDGGGTWIVHPPDSKWPAQTNKGIHFLYDPATKYGDSTGRTWLVETDGQGVWRTTDAGATWSQVSTWNVGHGMPQICYAGNHALYLGATPYLLRSTDNGGNWTLLKSGGLPYSYYMGIIGDGNLLYTTNSYPNDGARYDTPFYTSSETDGLTWKAYDPANTGSPQKFDNGPAWMAFDRVHRIAYSVNWAAGVWALKVVDTATSANLAATRKRVASHSAPKRIMIRDGESLRASARAGFYDIKGQRVRH